MTRKPSVARRRRPPERCRAGALHGGRLGTHHHRTDGAGGGHQGTDPREGHLVYQVRHEHPTPGEHARHLTHEVGGGEFIRHAGVVEGVEDDEILAGVPDQTDPGSTIGGADLDPAVPRQGRFHPDLRDQDLIRLQHDLRRPRPGRCHIARDAHRGAADVQRPDRCR